jgi:hypothetical protein
MPLVLRVRQRTVMGIMGWPSTAMAGPVQHVDRPGTVAFTSMPLHRLRSGAYVAWGLEGAALSDHGAQEGIFAA